VDYYLRAVILTVGFTELGNPAGRGLILSRMSHLRRNGPNMHSTTNRNYSLIRK
jgi:hypothetical protein